jgi:hypothetical protein
MTCVKRPQKIALGEMRAMGIRCLLVYCSGYKCSHNVEINVDRWSDDVRLSDLEPLFTVPSLRPEGSRSQSRFQLGQQTRTKPAGRELDLLLLASDATAMLVHMLLMFGLGLVSPVLAIVFAFAFYAHHRKKRPENPIPVLAYVLLLLVCGSGAYFLGLIYGTNWACSPPAENLCGLTAFLIVAPLSSAFAMLLVGVLILLLPAGRAPENANPPA